MKVIYVVDSVSNLNTKINLLKTHFGAGILYVVKSNLCTLFKTYGHEPNAVYSHNLSLVIHTLLSRAEPDDLVICYSSLDITTDLINKFIAKIGDRQKIVNVMPNYNAFENMHNGAYNVFVKSLFKAPDSMASEKLQFIPAPILSELLDSHFGNRLFDIGEKYIKTLHVDDKAVNKSLKTKSAFSKFSLIPIIVALVLTMALVICLAFVKMHYLIILVFVLLYILDLVLAVIFQYKSLFDKRFLH
jgi:hypothetical protein